ncbi:hypothetical protein BC828DRAFT_389535 [Blastocladiella britannica]|nr:hypothetical protein BC828DRAFT_389535 [Blastocladiella britannica]
MSSATDLSSQFAVQFAADIDALTSQLTTTPTAATLDAVHQAVSALERRVTDATLLYLPKYDQAKYLTALRALSAQIESTRASLRSSSRFSFKSRSRLAPLPSSSVTTDPPPATAIEAATTNTSSSADAAVAADPSVIRIANVPPNATRLVTIDRPGADIHIANVGPGALVVVAHPRGSPHAPPRAVHVHAVAPGAVVVVAAAVDGSLLMEAAANCIVALAAVRQVRIHHAHRLVLAAHVVSDPIIEDSDGVLVASGPASTITGSDRDGAAMLPGLETLLAHPSRMDHVKDFHWLVGSTPSPNWAQLDDVHASTLNAALLATFQQTDATDISPDLVAHWRTCISSLLPSPQGQEAPKEQ